MARASQLHVVDDASTDDTPRVLEAASDDLRATLHPTRNEQNTGHGPSLLRAYRLAVDCGADYVLQVDGDGQFDGRQCADLARALTQASADVAVGCRTDRQDPWFRKALSRSLRLYLQLVFGVRSRDPNCPFRLYRRRALREMLDDIPHDAAIPNIYLTILAARRDIGVVDVPVAHRARRGPVRKGAPGDSEAPRSWSPGDS